MCTSVSHVRAFENHCFYLVSNRVGIERYTEFIGSSHIVDCFGNVLSQADETTETIIYSSLNLGDADNKRLEFGTDSYVDLFSDRTPGFYQKIVETG